MIQYFVLSPITYAGSQRWRKFVKGFLCALFLQCKLDFRLRHAAVADGAVAESERRDPALKRQRTVSAWNLEWIGHKRHSCKRCIEK